MRRHNMLPTSWRKRASLRFAAGHTNDTGPGNQSRGRRDMGDDLLFDLPPPLVTGYLAWEARNRIKVSHVPEWRDAGEWVAALTIRTGPAAAEEAAYNDFMQGPGCWIKRSHYAGDAFGYGDTRDEAVAALCRIHGIPLYGEREEKPRRISGGVR
jgi:hypothetical protein